MREFIENNFFRQSLATGLAPSGYGKTNIPGLMVSVGQVPRGGVPEGIEVDEFEGNGDFPFPQDMEVFVGRRDGIYTIRETVMVSSMSSVDGGPFAYVYDGAVFAASNTQDTFVYDSRSTHSAGIGFSDAVYVAGRIVIGGCAVPGSMERWSNRVVWMDAGGLFNTNYNEWEWVELDSRVLCLGKVGDNLVVAVTERACYVGSIVEEPVVGISFRHVSGTGAWCRMARAYNRSSMVFLGSDRSLMLVSENGVQRLAFPSEWIERRLSGVVYGWNWGDDMWLAGDGGGVVISQDFRIGEITPMVTSAGWQGSRGYRYVMFNPLKVGASGLTRVTQVNVGFSGRADMAEVAIGYRMDAGDIFRATEWVRASGVGVVKRHVVGESFLVGVRWTGDAVLTDVSIGWQKHDKRNYRGSVSVSSSVA